MRSRRAWCWVLVLAASCGSREASVFVEVRTDLAPGIELGGLEVTLLVDAERMLPRALETRRVSIDAALDYAAGVRVADFEALPLGTYAIAASALDRYGAPLVLRQARIDLDAPRVVTIVLTRDCVGVVCPGPSDPSGATSCVRGRCVAPECGAGNPSACPGALCEDASDCTASVECAEVRCDSGFCFEQGLDVRCAEGEWCDPAAGCAPIPTCDPALCADADPCTEDRCEGALCIHTPLSGVACDDGVYCNGADSCSEGVCTQHAGDPCAATACSEEEDRCLECASDAQCGATTRGAWSGCTYPSTCAEVGERTREVYTPRCVAGACRTVTSTETDRCDQDTDGRSCGSTSRGDWSECDYTDTCDATAARERDVTERVCRSGTCRSETSTESEGCARDTEGRVCDTGGTYCGRDRACRVCRDEACVVNTPHYDAACNPSCGASAALCGSAATCCAAATACATTGGGPWSDCPVCCALAFCP